MRPLLILLAGLALSDTQAAAPRVKRAIDAMEAEVGRIPLTDPLRPIADRIVERLRLAHTLAVPANLPPGVDPAGRRMALRERLLRPVRANLTWRSPTSRHALRAAVMAGPALAYTMLWFTPYDHWLTMTIIATMQPFFALTFTRAVERVIGTILGGLVAAAVGRCARPADDRHRHVSARGDRVIDPRDQFRAFHAGPDAAGRSAGRNRPTRTPPSGASPSPGPR